jgi:hypothetical protein
MKVVTLKPRDAQTDPDPNQKQGRVADRTDHDHREKETGNCQDNDQEDSHVHRTTNHLVLSRPAMTNLRHHALSDRCHPSKQSLLE